MRDRVELFLKSFEQAYQKRDLENLNQYLDIFFSKHQSEVFGTSTLEIYTSHDEVKACAKNDWLYWGDLSLDYHHPITKVVDDLIIIHVKGAVQYEFEDHEDTDQRFVELITSLNAESDETDVNHMIFQQHEISYILDHFLHRRDNYKRKNLVPLSLTFMVKEEDQQFKIHQLSFDVETHDLYPDVVIHPYTPYQAHIDEDMDILKIKGSSVIKPFDFEVSENFYVVDVDGNMYHKQEDLKDILNRYDELDMAFEHSLLCESKQTISFMTLGQGVLKKDHLELRTRMKNEIGAILDSDYSNLKKLFQIRRKISLVDKINALDQDIILPMKCIGVLSKHKDTHTLEMMKFSYPMDMILEDKYTE